MAYNEATKGWHLLGIFIKQKPDPDPVDGLIDSVLEDLGRGGIDDKAYLTKLTILERLYKLKQSRKREPVSRNTIAIIVGNLVIVLIIVIFEQRHVISSKGLGQLLKLR